MEVYFGIIKVHKTKFLGTRKFTGRYFLPLLTPISSNTSGSFLVMDERTDIVESAYWCLLLDKFPSRDFDKYLKTLQDDYKKHKTMEFLELDRLPVSKIQQVRSDKVGIKLSKHGKFIRDDLVLEFSADASKQANKPIWSLYGDINVTLDGADTSIIGSIARKVSALYKAVRR